MTHKSSSLNLILLGGPGAGKGTQAKRLTQLLKLAHVASGDLFRENLRNNTELGQLAHGYMEKGQLVPDDVTIGMVRERISRPDTSNGFILDGFPRTLPQAEALKTMLLSTGREITAVLYFNVSDDEIVLRLGGRLICLNCQAPYHLTLNPPKIAGVCNICRGELYQRDDDKPETVRARLVTYHRQTAPLINYYKTAGLLYEINGEGEVEEVTERMLMAANKILKKLKR